MSPKRADRERDPAPRKQKQTKNETNNSRLRDEEEAEGGGLWELSYHQGGLELFEQHGGGSEDTAAGAAVGGSAHGG